MKISKAVLMTAAALITCAPPTATAATYQWDFNQSAAGLGGTGNWTAAGLNWDLVASGSDDGTDVTVARALNQSTNVLQFGGGSAGTVTLTGASSAAGLIFTGVDGNELSTSSTSTNTLTVGTTGITVRNSATISGAAKLIASGAQTWTIDEFKTLRITSDFSGGFTKAGLGVLELGNISAALGGLTLSGGTLTFSTSGPVSLTSLAINGGSSLTGSEIRVTGSDISVSNPTGTSATISAVIGGTRGLTKTGAGDLSLQAANTFSGLTTISAGTLTLGSAASLSGSVKLQGTAGSIPVLDLGSGSKTFTALTLSGAVNASVTGGTISNTPITANNTLGTVTITSVISGTSSITKSGAGTLAISNHGSMNGIVAVSGGTIDFGLISTPFTFSALNLSGTVNAAVTGGVINNTSVSATNTAGTITVSSRLSGGTGYRVDKSGAGVLVLAGNNDYQGPTNLTGGTLSAGANNAFGSGLVTISANATLGAAASSTVSNPFAVLGSFTFSGPNELAQSGGEISLSSTPVITVSSGTLNLGGVINEKTGITSALGLTKEGTGTLVLGGANAYGGATTINAGTLRLGVNGVLPQAVTVGAGTLDIGLQTETTLNAGSITLSGVGSIVGGILRNTAVSVTNTSGVATISSRIIGDKAVQKSGAGELRLTGDVASKGALGGINSFTITAGTLTVPNYTSMDSGTFTATGGISNFTGGAYLKSIVFGNGSPTLSGGLITTSGDFSIGSGAGLVWLDATLAGTSKIYYSGRNGFVILKKPTTLLGDVNGVVLEATDSLGNMMITAAQTSWDGTKTIKNSADLLIGVDEAFGSAILEFNGGRLLANSPANTVRVISSPVSLNADMVLATWNDNVGGMSGTYTSPLELKGEVFLNQGVRTITTGADLTLSGPISGGSPGLSRVRGGGIIKMGTEDLTLSGDVFSKGALGGVSSFEIKAGTVILPMPTSLEGTYTATAGTSTFTGGAYLKKIVFGDSSPTLAGGVITTSGDFEFSQAGNVTITATLAGNSKISFKSVRDTDDLYLNAAPTLTGDANNVVIENVGNGFAGIWFNAAHPAGWAGWNGKFVVLTGSDMFFGVDNALAGATFRINSGRIFTKDGDDRSLSNPIQIRGDFSTGWSGTHLGTITFSGPVDLRNADMTGGVRSINTIRGLTLTGQVFGGSIAKSGGATLKFTNDANAFDGLTINAGIVDAEGSASLPAGYQLGVGNVIVKGGAALNATGNLNVGGSLEIYHNADVNLGATARMNVAGNLHLWGDQSNLNNGHVVIAGDLIFDGYEGNVINGQSAASVTSKITTTNIYKFTYGYQGVTGKDFGVNNHGDAIMTGELIADKIIVVGDPAYWGAGGDPGQASLALSGKSTVRLVSLEHDGSFVVNAGALGAAADNPSIIQVSDQDQYRKDRLGNSLASLARGSVSFSDLAGTPNFFGTFRIVGVNSLLRLWAGSLDTTARLEGNGILQRESSVGTYNFIQTDGGFTGKINVIGGDLLFTNPRAPASGTSGFNPSQIDIQGGSYRLNLDEGISASLASGGFVSPFAPLTWANTVIKGDSYFRKQGLGELVLSKASPDFNGHVSVQGGILTLQMVSGQQNGLLGQATSAANSAQSLTLTADADSRAIGGTFRLLDVASGSPTQKFANISISTDATAPNMGAAHRIILGSGANLSFTAATAANFTPAAHVVLGIYGLSANAKLGLNAAAANLSPAITLGANAVVGSTDFGYYSPGSPAVMGSVVAPTYLTYDPTSVFSNTNSYLQFSGTGATGVAVSTTAKGIKFTGAAQVTGAIDSQTNQTQGAWAMDGILYAANAGGSSGVVRVGVGSLTAANVAELVVQQWNAGDLIIDSKVTNRSTTLSTALLKAGSGALVLANGNNDYKGGTYVIQGHLDINASSSFFGETSAVGAATGTIYVNGRGGDPSQSGASIGTSASNSVVIANSLTAYEALNYVGDAGKYLTIKGTFTGDAPASRGYSVINVVTGGLRLSGSVRSVPGGAWLKKDGAGVLEITGVSSYAGTEVINGKLQVMSSLAAGSATGSFGLLTRPGSTVQFGLDGFSNSATLAGGSTTAGSTSMLVADASSLTTGMFVSGTGIVSGTSISAITVAPVTLTGGATTAGSNAVSVASVTGAYRGMVISGAGIAAGTSVTNIVGNTLTLSNAATSTASGLTFSSVRNTLTLSTAASATTVAQSFSAGNGGVKLTVGKMTLGGGTLMMDITGNPMDTTGFDSFVSNTDLVIDAATTIRLRMNTVLPFVAGRYLLGEYKRNLLGDVSLLSLDTDPNWGLENPATLYFSSDKKVYAMLGAGFRQLTYKGSAGYEVWKTIDTTSNFVTGTGGAQAAARFYTSDFVILDDAVSGVSGAPKTIKISGAVAPASITVKSGHFVLTRNDVVNFGDRIARTGADGITLDEAPALYVAAGTLTLDINTPSGAPNNTNVNWFNEFSKVILQGGVLELKGNHSLGPVIDTTGVLRYLSEIRFTGGTLRHVGPNGLTDYSSLFSTAQGQIVKIDTNGNNVNYKGHFGAEGMQLWKIGAGTLSLSAGPNRAGSGDSNSFPGGVRLQGGVLELLTTRALGTSGEIIFQGGTLKHSAPTGGGLDLEGNSIDYSARFGSTPNQSVSVDVAGQNISWAFGIKGTGTTSFVKAGAGLLTMNGASTHTGENTLNQGSLKIGHRSALGSGVLNLAAGSFDASSLALTNAISYRDASVTMANMANYAGILTIASGVTFVDAQPIGGTIDVLLTSTLDMRAGAAVNILRGQGGVAYRSSSATLQTAGSYTGTLQVLDNATFDVRFAFGGGITANLGSLTLTSGNVDGAITSSRTVQKLTASSFALAGNNTFSGALDLQAGRLLLRSSGAIGGTGSIAFNGGTLVYDNALSSSIDPSTRATGAAKVEVSADAGTVVWAGVTPASSLEKSGAGRLTIRATDSFTSVKIFDGSLALGKNGATSGRLFALSGSAKPLEFLGGTLEFREAVNPAISDYSAYVQTAGSQTFRIGSFGSAITFATAFGDASDSLVVTGDATGSFVLGAANSWSGISINSGTLGLGALGAFGSASTVLTVTNSGVVDFQNRAAANPMTLNAHGKRLTRAAAYTGLITVGAGFEPWADERINGTFQVGLGAKLRMKSGGDVFAIKDAGEINYEAGLTGDTSLFTGVLRTMPLATYDLLSDFGGSLDANTYANSTLKLSNGSVAGNLVAAQLVEKRTVGRVTLNGDAYFYGGLSVTGGTLAVSLGLNDDLRTGPTGIDVSPGARMELRTQNYDLTLNPPVTVQAGGSFAKQGIKTLTLAGVNNFNGDLELQDGVVSLQSAAAIGGSGKVVFAGGTLRYSSLNNTDISGRIDLARSTAIRIDTGNAPLVTFAGIGSPSSPGPASLTKSGSTVLSITGPSYYAGGTTLSAGDLAVSHGQALGTGALTLSAGRLRLQGASAVNLQVGGNLTINSGSMLMMRLADQSSVVPAADSVTMSGGLLFTGTGSRTLWLSSLSGSTAPRDISNGFYKLFQVGASAPAVDLTKLAVNWEGGGPRQQRKEFIFAQNTLNPLEYGIKVQGVTLADLIWVGNPTNLSAVSGNWQEALLGSFRGEDQQFFDLDRVTFDNTSAAREVMITGTKSVGYRAGLAGVNPAEILVTGSSSYRFAGDKGVNADLLTIDAGSQLDLRTTGGGKFKNINLGGNLVLNAGSALEAPLPGGILFSGGRLVYASSTQDLSGYFASNAGTDYKIQVDAAASAVTFANGLGGAGSTLLKYGSGQLRLSAPSTYDGGTTIAEGQLVVAAAGVLGAGNVELTGGDLDVGGLNPFTTNGLATINIRSAASALANFSALTNRVSIVSGVDYGWTSAHQGELQVLGTGKVDLNLSGSIVRLTGNKTTDYYAGGLADASAYTGYMNIKSTKTLALSGAFGGSLDVNEGAWLAHDGGVVNSLRGVGTVNYSNGAYADAALFGGLLKVLDGRQFVLNQDFGGSIDTTLSDVTNPAHVGLLLNGGILRQNLTARAVTVNGDVELRGTGNVTGKMTLNSGAFLKLADTIALIPQAGLQIDFKGGVLGMSALYSRDISPYIIETTDRIRINTDGYGQPANVTFASQLKAAGLDKSGDGVLTLLAGDSEFRDGELKVLGGTLKAGADDSFGRNRSSGLPGQSKLSRIHVNGVTAVLDLNAKQVYNDIFYTSGDIRNASNYRGTVSLDVNAGLKLDEAADFNGNIQTQDGSLTLVRGRFVGNINAPAQVSIFSGVPYDAPTKKVVLEGSRASDEIELTGSNYFDIGPGLVGLEIKKGTLVVGSYDALGASGRIDFLDGIIRFKDIGVPHRDISSRITSANAASEANFEVDANAQVTFASGLDSRGMIKLGAGTLNLTGWSNYSHSTDRTQIRQGTLQLSGQGGMEGAVIVSAGAKLRLDLDNVAPAVVNDISGAGTVEHANANSLTLSGDSTFTGNLTVTGGGRLIAGSADGFGSASGGYVIPGANAVVDFDGNGVAKNVDFREASASVVNAQNYAGTLFVRGGVRFDLTMHERFGGTVNLENGSLYMTDGDRNNRPGSPATELHILKGAGGVDYEGGAIENADQYTGTLTMRTGTRYNVAQDFGGSFSLSGLNTSLVLESGSIGGSVAAVGSANAVSKETADTFVLRGSNDLSAGLVVRDGTLVLRGSNVLTGGLTINGGVLELGHADALGAAGDIVFSPSTVGGNGWIRYTADNQQDISSRIRIDDNSSINIDTNGQNVRFGTAVNAGIYWADLIKKGAGDLILSPNANSNYGYSFVKIQEGRLVLDSAGALGDPSDPTNLFEIWFDGGRLRHTINNTLSYAGRVIAIDGKDVSVEVDSGASVAYAAGISGGLSTLRKFGAGTLSVNGDSTLVGQDADLSAVRLAVTVSSWVEDGSLVAGSIGALGANAIAVGNAGSTTAARVDLGGFAMANEVFVMNSAAQIKGAQGFIGQVYIPETVNFTATSTIGSDDGFGSLSTTFLEGSNSTLTIGRDAVVPGGQGSVYNVVGDGKISFASGVTGKIATDTPGDGALLPSTAFQGGVADHFSGVIEIQSGANISLNTDLNNQVQLNVGGKLGLAIDDVWFVGSPSPSGAQLNIIGGGTIEKNSAGVTNLRGALGSGFTGTYVVSDGVLRTASDNALGGGRVVVKGAGQLDMSGFNHSRADVVIVDAPRALINAGQWGLDPITLQRSAKYIEFLSTQDDPSARTTAHTSLELPTLADGGFYGKVRVTNGVKVDLSNGFYAPVDHYDGTLEQLAAYQQTLSVFGNLVVTGSFNPHNATYADLRGNLDANKVVMHSGSVVDFDNLASAKSILVHGGRLRNAVNYTGDLVIAEGAALSGVAGNFGSGRVVLFGGSQLDIYDGFANKVLYHGGVLSNGSLYRGELTIDPNADANWTGAMHVASGAIGGKIIAPSTTSLRMNGSASSVEMHANTVLSGSGTIANLSMQSGTVLKPGNSPGIMNITNTALIGGARAVLEFFDVNGPRGVGGYDSFNISGTLDLRQLSPSNRFILNLRSLSSITPDTAGTSLNLGTLTASNYRDFKIFDYNAGTLLRPISYNIAELFALDTSAFNVAGGITGFYDVDGTSIVGTNRFAIYDDGQGIYLRYGASPLENFASPLVSPLVVNLPAIHVGDPFSSSPLTIVNNQTAPGTTQGLNVTVTTPVQAPATTNGGSVTNLAAGITNVGGISVGLQQPTVGGIYQGTVNLRYRSASLDPDSGVPPTDIGQQDVIVNGIAYEIAAPVFNSTVNLGSVRRGSTLGDRNFTARNLSVANGAQSAAPYGELLDAEFQNAASGVVAVGTITGLTPTQTDTSSLSLYVTTAGIAAGDLSRTVDLVSTSKAVLGSGLSDTVTTTQVQINGTIYDAAVGNVASADRSINLGVVRVGGTFASRNIAITNDVAPSNWAETLGASFDLANTSASITATGSFTGLAAGVGANSALAVTINNTASVGVVGGTARVGFTTEAVNGSGLGIESVGHQDITVTGTVHALAALDSIATIQNGRTHVGKQFTDVSVRIANDATLSGGYSDDLQVGLRSFDPRLAVTGGVARLAPNAVDTSSMTVRITDYQTVGDKNFDFTLASRSLEPTAGLGDINLADRVVSVQGLVYSGKSVWSGASGAYTNANWSSWAHLGGIPGIDGTYSVGDTATFNGASAQTIVVTGINPEIASITFANSIGTTLSSAAVEKFILGTGVSLAEIQTQLGTNTISSGIDLVRSLRVTTAAGSSLALSGALVNTGTATGVEFTGSGEANLGSAFTGPRLNFTLSGGTLNTSINQAFGTGTFTSGTLAAPAASTAAPVVVSLDTFAKTGSGDVVLGHAADAGALRIDLAAGQTATVTGGSLKNNAALQAALDVSAATLSGVGSSGTLRMLAGSTFAPGNSIGRYTVNGSLSLSPGSTTRIEVSPTSATVLASDVIAVTGAVQLGGALVVSQLDLAHPLVETMRSTIIEHASAAGTFDSVAFDSATALRYLTLRPMVETIGNRTDLYFMVAAPQADPRTVSSLPNILGRTNSMFVRSISGDPYARLAVRGASAAQGLTLDSLLGAKDNLDQAVSGAQDNTWVEGYGQTIAANQGSGAWGYDYRMGGVSAGIDLIRETNWVVGVAFGLSQSDARHEFKSDRTAATAYDIGFYSTSRGDDASVSVVGFYSQYNIRHTRMADTAAGSLPVIGRPDASRAGVRLDYDSAIIGTPDSKTYLRMGLGAGLVQRSAFSETGEDAIIMNFDAVDMPYFQLDFGLGYSTDLFEDDHTWQVFGEGMFTRHVVGSNPTCQARFVNPVGGSGEVTVPSPEYTFLQFQPSLGVSWREGMNSAEFKIFAEMRAGKTAPGASASFKMRF